MAWQLAQGRAGGQLGFIPEPEFCSCGETRGRRDEPGCSREAGRGFHTPVGTPALHPNPAGRQVPAPALLSQFPELSAFP